MTAQPVLGRHVQHDPRSRDFAFQFRAALELKTVLWPHDGPVLDQGQIGACTGNALADWLNTQFAQQQAYTPGYLTEADAQQLYSLATKLDNIPGEWPPTDTGSSGLAVCQAGVQLGRLTAYHHAFGMDHLLVALQATPVIVGTAWTQDMFTPDADDVIHASGDIKGGHEYLILGADMDAEQLTMLNSWSAAWGNNGRALIGFDDFEQLLADQGDVQVPIV